MTIQKRTRIVASYRIKKDRKLRYETVCAKHKLFTCLVTEALIDKFIRGEIILVQKDFDLIK